MPENIFPRKIAKDQVFCNRVEQKARIAHNIHHQQHTLIISPRRYGKTSLAFQVIAEEGLPFGHAQFLNAYSSDVIVQRLTLCLNQLLSRLVPPSQKMLKKVSQFLRRVRLALKIVGVEVKFELEPMDKNPELIIINLLDSIESVLENYNKRAIIFFDEFQDIANADLTDSIQSVLRDFAQRTEYVSFIVSGSNRKMLDSMFNDRNKPFYKLFDQLSLCRIESKHYVPFLQEKAKERWEVELPMPLLTEIFSLTENHAYYVNRICSELWQLDIGPETPDVMAAWENVVASEFNSLAADLSKLTKNQRKVLQAISTHSFVKEPTSHTFLEQVGLAHGSVSLALKSLYKDDYVELLPQGYRAVDPALKYVLRQ